MKKYIFILAFILITSQVSFAVMLKTGQTKCYNNTGVEINCFTSMQDGEFQKGSENKFHFDNSLKTIFDYTTGLSWAVIDNYTASWYDAFTYCDNLNHGGYVTWRLPTLEELMTISDKGKKSLPYYYDIFDLHKNIRYIFWTNNDSLNNPKIALTVDFQHYGEDSSFDKTDKYNNFYCVRTSDFKITNKFKRDDKNEVVIDTENNLMWQDNWQQNSAQIQHEWIDAIHYCDILTLGGYDDWRLPNYNELFYLTDRSNNYSISDEFNNTVWDYYWTSTSLTPKPSEAWVINFKGGYDTTSSKNIKRNVRCVRNINKDNSSGAILQTGQTKCYNSAGQTISCAGSGQDGEYQFGKSRSFCRFTKNGNLTEDISLVDDYSTGLEWVDSGYVKYYKANDIFYAKSYCDNLSYYLQSDWRLPSIQELNTIVDRSKTSGPLVFDEFKGTLGKYNHGYYWSSTLDSLTHSFVTDFKTGYSHTVGTNDKTPHVRCVGGNKYTINPTYVRDKLHIISASNGLMWFDNQYLSGHWQEALSHCNQLNYGGFSDWHLPNINELYSLLSFNRTTGFDEAFKYVNNKNYWSSTTCEQYPEIAWTVNFQLKRIITDNKTNNNINYLCVRNTNGCSTTGITLNSPTSKKIFNYKPVITPVIDIDEAINKPVGFGNTLAGHLTLSVKTPNFKSPVDIYFAVYAPDVINEYFLFNTSNQLKPLSQGLVPWKTNVTCGINEVLTNHLSLYDLPKGTYNFYLAVVPSGVTPIKNYYLWKTEFYNSHMFIY